MKNVTIYTQSVIFNETFIDMVQEAIKGLPLNVFYKLHRGDPYYEKYKAKGLNVIRNCDIKELFQRTDLAIISDISTVAVECLEYKIPALQYNPKFKLMDDFYVPSDTFVNDGVVQGFKNAKELRKLIILNLKDKKHILKILENMAKVGEKHVYTGK